MTQMLVDELYGSDEKWLHDGELIGEADRLLQSRGTWRKSS